jgi:hypothetical protein
MPAARLAVSGDLYARRTVGRIGMIKDPIVNEVRRAREEQAAKFSFDVKAILAAARKRQRRSRHKVVSLQPNKRLSA